MQRIWLEFRIHLPYMLSWCLPVFFSLAVHTNRCYNRQLRLLIVSIFSIKYKDTEKKRVYINSRRSVINTFGKGKLLHDSILNKMLMSTGIKKFDWLFALHSTKSIGLNTGHCQRNWLMWSVIWMLLLLCTFFLSLYFEWRDIKCLVNFTVLWFVVYIRWTSCSLVECIREFNCILIR